MSASLFRSALCTATRVSRRTISTAALRSSSRAHPTAVAQLNVLRFTRPVRFFSDYKAEAAADLPKVVFLGNVPWGMSETDIRYEFSGFGTMSELYLGKDAGGRPAGWALMQFADPKVAADLIESHKNEPFVFSGRQAVIEFAKKQTSISQADRTAAATPSKTLYAGNISFESDEKAIFDAFAPFGEIKRVSLGRFPDGRPRGFAHVEFASQESAENAMNLGEPLELDGRPLFLDFAAHRKTRREDAGGNKRHRTNYGTQ